jgi:hypothetical protein
LVWKYAIWQPCWWGWALKFLMQQTIMRQRPSFLNQFFIIPQAKRANIVSGMVENLHRKKFSPARIGVEGCRLSVCLSVRPSVRLSVCLRYFVE